MSFGVKLVIFAAATLLLTSCTSQSAISAKAPPVKSISFVTAKDFRELTHSESESEFVEQHISTGAAAGALGGAAVGAAACGPVFYGACVAILSWYGLAAGSAGGAALGHYNYTGLSDTDSAYVEQVLSGINSRRDFDSDLSDQVRLRVPADSIAAPQDAEYQVVVWVNQINFTEVEKELVSTQLHGTMILARAPGSKEQSYRELFTAESPAKDIDDLIAGDGQLLENAIDECLVGIALLMEDRLEQMLLAGAGKLPPGP